MSKILVEIYPKDKDWLKKMKEKLRRRGMKDVINDIIKLIKAHKIEEELK